MGRHAVRSALLIASVGAQFSSCGATPTSPTNISRTSTSTAAKLQLVGVDVSDAGQDALGAWQYSVTMSLRETAGVDVTLTNIGFQAFSPPSTFQVTGSIAPMSSVSANSMGDTTFVFKADRHVQLTALAVGVRVDFRDTNGNVGWVGACWARDASGGDALCWEY